jgi:hypothetical protein
MTSPPVPLTEIAVLLLDTLTTAAEVVSVAMHTGGVPYAATKVCEPTPEESLIVPALTPSFPVIAMGWKLPPLKLHFSPCAKESA